MRSTRWLIQSVRDALWRTLSSVASPRSCGLLCLTGGILIDRLEGLEIPHLLPDRRQIGVIAVQEGFDQPMQTWFELRVQLVLERHLVHVEPAHSLQEQL